MMSSPAPTANPLTCRLAGVVLAPMNSVASAKAGAAVTPSSVVSAARRISLIPNDTMARRMDVRLSDDQELLRRSIREFAESELRPHVMAWDEAQQFPRELLT